MSKYFVWFLTIIIFEHFVIIGHVCAKDQAKRFWWSNISYQYDTEREFVTLTPEFKTNALPFDLELYGFVDFTGDHGHDETNLKNHFGSFNLFKPLDTFGIAEDNIVLHMFDVAMEYNIDSFADDRCYFGFRWFGVNIWKQLYAFCEVKYEDFQEPFDDAFGIGFGLMWQWYFIDPDFSDTDFSHKTAVFGSVENKKIR